MASTKFYLDLRGKAADGKGSVLIQLFHNHSMTSFSTGIRISRSDWDGNRVVKIPEAETLNATLEEMKGKIDKGIALLSFDEMFPIMTAAEVKRELSNLREKKLSRHLISDLFHEYVTTGELADGTKELYKYTLKRILAFAGDQVVIESVNLKWLREFDKFLAKNQVANGRSIYLRCFRAVCKYAQSTGIQFQYPFGNFHIKQDATMKRSVSVELFRKFLSFPTTAANQRYRDYFLLMFYLIGINAADLLLAKPSAIVNGRLYYVRKKTHKKYSVKIEPEAEGLLKKYKGKKWLLDAMDTCKDYRNFLHEMNDALKTIGTVKYEEIQKSDDLFAKPVRVKKIDPVIPKVSTYYTRHCWATLAHEAGVPIETIAQALGHSAGNRTTLIYVKFDQQKVDAANRLVIDYVGLPSAPCME